MTENLNGENYVKIPKIRTYGMGDLNRLLPFEYDGHVGRKITNLGGECRNIHRGSVTLVDYATLFQAYLRSEFPQDNRRHGHEDEELDTLELSDDVKELLKHSFETFRGIVTNDACDYDNGNKDMKRVKPTDRRVRWIINPEGFEKTGSKWSTGDKWSAIGGEPHYILLPEPGYIELTVDGLLRPDTGTPFSTVETKGEAVASFMARKFPYEFARRAVSYFCSRDEEQGTASVIHRCWGKDNLDKHNDEMFTLGAHEGPQYSDLHVGSLRSIRSPSE